MKLPKIDKPKYSTVIPSTKEKVYFHPYTIENEKILLHLKENKDRTSDEVLSAMVDLINSCYLNIDANKLTSFDLEFLFIQLRAKSVNEIAVINVVCTSETDEICNKKLVDDRDVSAIQIPLISAYIEGEIKDEHIIIGDTDGETVYLNIRYPTIEDMIEIEKISKEDSDYFAIYKCTKSVYDSNTVYPIADVSFEEYKEWFKSLPATVQTIAFLYFAATPKLTQKVKYKCMSCGRERDYEVSGLSGFFSPG